MKEYPAWKHLLVALALFIAALYALPSSYPSSPVLQIRSAGQNDSGESPLIEIERAIRNEGINNVSIADKGDFIEVRFAPGRTEDQLVARRAIAEELSQNYIVALNTATTAPQWLQSLGASPIALGLDLRGGVHFLLQVDIGFAVSKHMEGIAEQLKGLYREERLRYRQIEINGAEVTVSFNSTSEVAEGERIAEESEMGLSIASNGDKLTLTLDDAAVDEITELAIEQNLETLRNRVDELGVAEPVITRQGNDRISVQLPGVQDTAQAKDILGRTAALELRGVDEARSQSATALAAGRRGSAPGNTQYFESTEGEALLLERRVVITGENIVDARPGFDDVGQPSVVIGLDSSGASRMSRYTRDHIGERLAILLIERDRSEIISAPSIQSELAGRFIIHGGNIDTKEANELSLLLRSGSLAAPLEIIEERTVGPTLGADNIRRGLLSVAGGFVVIALFIAVYYAVFGTISVYALIANLLLLTALLAGLQATLTLPGLAGFALTLGMAIDANVLINERIREEISGAAPALRAIESGYSRAFTTILDANVTTLIAGIALFAFGSGPVRGFAVVLCLGILTSMFSAIMVSRGMVDLVYGRRKAKAISIG